MRNVAWDAIPVFAIAAGLPVWHHSIAVVLQPWHILADLDGQPEDTDPDTSTAAADAQLDAPPVRAGWAYSLCSMEHATKRRCNKTLLHAAKRAECSMNRHVDREMQHAVGIVQHASAS